MQRAYLYESDSTARYGMVSSKRACSVSSRWNMDHKAGYKISNIDKVPLCLIKRHVMSYE